MSRLGRSQPVPPFAASHGFVDPGPGPVGTTPKRPSVVENERRRPLPLDAVVVSGASRAVAPPAVVFPPEPLVVPVDERGRRLPVPAPFTVSGVTHWHVLPPEPTVVPVPDRRRELAPAPTVISGVLSATIQPAPDLPPGPTVVENDDRRAKTPPLQPLTGHGFRATSTLGGCYYGEPFADLIGWTVQSSQRVTFAADGVLHIHAVSVSPDTFIGEARALERVVDFNQPAVVSVDVTNWSTGSIGDGLIGFQVTDTQEILGFEIVGSGAGTHKIKMWGRQGAATSLFDTGSVVTNFRAVLGGCIDLGQAGYDNFYYSTDNGATWALAMQSTGRTFEPSYSALVPTVSITGTGTLDFDFQIDNLAYAGCLPTAPTNVDQPPQPDRHKIPDPVVLSGARAAVSVAPTVLPPSPLYVPVDERGRRILPGPPLSISGVLATFITAPEAAPPPPLYVPVDDRGRRVVPGPAIAISGALASFVTGPPITPPPPVVVAAAERDRRLVPPAVSHGFDDAVPSLPEIIESVNRQRWQPIPPLAISGVLATSFIIPFVKPPLPVLVENDSRDLRRWRLRPPDPTTTNGLLTLVPPPPPPTVLAGTDWAANIASY